jgi:hypothetical protein
MYPISGCSWEVLQKEHPEGFEGASTAQWYRSMLVRPPLQSIALAWK